MHPGSSSPMDELLVGVGLGGLITARKEDLDKDDDILLVWHCIIPQMERSHFH